MLKKFFLLLVLAFFLAGCATSSTITPQPPTSPATPPVSSNQPSSDDNMNHGTEETSETTERLNASPRHQEWVEVKNGDKTIYVWAVYPEASEKRPVVLLIHENRGLNDWARSMADQVAEAGYIAVAPDLLSNFSPTEKKTSDFVNEDAARTALSTLDPAKVTSDLQAVADWAKTIPASNGKLASAGFCWGGGQSFQLATQTHDLDLAMVFYGTGPTDTSAYEKISSPIYGFYGGADERVNATIADSEKYMKAAGKTFEYKIYDGAGHAFMRIGEDVHGDQANVSARNAAWARMKEILSTL